MAVPLGHLLVGLGLLIAGLGVATAAAAGLAPALGLAGGWTALAAVHLLLAGWLCVTIMGAMTQFVPVWSGRTLHSRRLARAQLLLVLAGLLGVVGVLLSGRPQWWALPGTVLLTGFWTFAYNVARTLPPARQWDVTERHFAGAIGALAVVTALGVLLAADLAVGLLGTNGAAAQLGIRVGRRGVRSAHATLAVFGVLLPTVVGALSQLVPMFAQSPFDRLDRPLRRFEELALPAGVVALAGGRLVGHAALARVGGLLVGGALLAFAIVLARRLAAARTGASPLTRRYALAAIALAAWATLALRTWVESPLAGDATLGAPGTAPLLLFGAIGAVVAGTLYHVVPFVVWVHRYSDRIGREAVPTVEELYSYRLAAVEGLVFTAGVVLIAAGGHAAGGGAGLVPRSPAGVAGAGLLLVAALFLAIGLGAVVRRHGRLSPLALLLARATDRSGEEPDAG